MRQTLIHPLYLPFTEEEVLMHFADVRKRGKCTKNKRHLKYYLDRAKRYTDYLSKGNRKGNSISEMRLPRQIEKDERFWLTTTMMKIFHSETRVQDFVKLFKMAYGDFPPIEGMEEWKDCFTGNLHLFFEVNLPSPPSYKKWLRKNLEKVQPIPYVIDSLTNQILKDLQTSMPFF